MLRFMNFLFFFPLLSVIWFVDICLFIRDKLFSRSTEFTCHCAIVINSNARIRFTQNHRKIKCVKVNSVSCKQSENSEINIHTNTTICIGSNMNKEKESKQIDLLNYAERKSWKNNLSKSKLNRYLNGKHLVCWSNAYAMSWYWNWIHKEKIQMDILGGFFFSSPSICCRLMLFYFIRAPLCLQVSARDTFADSDSFSQSLSLFPFLFSFIYKCCVDRNPWATSFTDFVKWKQWGKWKEHFSSSINYRLDHKSRISFQQPINHYWQRCCNTAKRFIVCWIIVALTR